MIPSRETPDEIAAVFDRLWPILRSVTGAGVRQTHDILGELVPLDRMEIPTGTAVFDWEIPPEWHLREAWIEAPDGRRFCDVATNNLHVVNYSAPFRGRIPRDELDAHLHSLPAHPEWTPYVTSYYQRRWGFCLPHAERERLPDGEYDVCIDSAFRDGSLTLSEAVLPGESTDEVLISTYTCHPSLANNELSGPLVAAFLYRRLAALPKRRLTYRFVFLPETIGAIAYLSKRGDHLRDNLIAGYVITCAGDRGAFTYKRSRRGTTLADRAAEAVLHCRPGPPAKIVDFFPTGSDERQYCSPGFDLPVGSIMRTMYGRFPEYHTSADNRDFISFGALQESVDVYLDVCLALENNRRYRSLCPFGEPQLGRRGLYAAPAAGEDAASAVEPMLWLFNLADGSNDLLHIAQRSGLAVSRLHEAAQRALEAGLLVIDD